MGIALKVGSVQGNYIYTANGWVSKDSIDNTTAADYANSQINKVVTNPNTTTASPPIGATSVFSPSQLQDNVSRGLITPNTTTATAGYDPILAQMSAIVFTYRGRTNDYGSMVNFFSDVKNVAAINSALSLTGAAPSTNIGYDTGTPSMHEFYYLCQLFKQFPDFTGGATTTDCQSLQAYITGLQNALTAQDATYAADKSSQRDNNNVAMTAALGAITTYYNGLNSKLACSLFVQNQSNQNDINAVLTAGGISTTGSTQTSNTTASTPNYALYLGIAVVVVVGFFVVKKMIKKD